MIIFHSSLVCTNVYNDQYCALHIGNCWNPSYAKDLVKNCKKTCVCGCCSAIPATTIATTNPATTTIPTTTTAATTPTTVKSTNVSTASQTTEGTGEGKTTAHALTKFSTQTPSKSKGILRFLLGRFYYVLFIYNFSTEYEQVNCNINWHNS